MEIIKLAKESNEIQRVVTLKENRNKRHKFQEFVIEGHAAIDQACKMGWEIKAFFYNRDKDLSKWAQDHLDQKRCKVAYALTSAMMDIISDKMEASELIAIVKSCVEPFEWFKPKANSVVVVFDEPKSPGNLGMLIRSMVAFGVSALVISGRAADEFDPVCIRASVGTFFSLPIYRVEGIAKFMETVNQIKQTKNVKIVATGDKGSTPLQEATFDSEVLFLIVGNETTGVSMGYKDAADQFVQIPLPGPFTSLNVAAAGSVFLYEIFKQRS
ncbi:MAG: hypothetical protein JHC93_03735 [Parachlamydiales bacterium]|nr:hypothetical protein [Parachlamydiales bacterium]